MHLLKYDHNAKTLTEVMPGEWAGDPACRYFFVEGDRAAVPILMHDGIGEIVWEHPSYQPPRLPAPAPSPRPSTLVDRVAGAINAEPFDSDAEARAAIREVAAWLRSESPLVAGNAAAWASLLEREANR